MMKALFASAALALTLGLSLTNASANDFSVLADVEAEAMTDADLDTIEGKFFDSFGAFGSFGGLPDFTQTNIWDSFAAWDNQLTSAMGSVTNNIVQTNVNDPNVVNAYWQRVNMGYNGSLEQFAFDWAATGGFSAQGLANFQATSNQIAAQQQSSFAGLQQAQQNSADALAGLNQGFFNNNWEFGNGLLGQGTFTGGFGQVVAPTTWGANSFGTFGGNTFFSDFSGQMFQMNPWTGTSFTPIFGF